VSPGDSNPFVSLNPSGCGCDCVAFQNVNDDTAPAFAVMQVTGTTLVNGAVVLTCDQPSTTFGAVYVVNGCYDVESEDYGRCTLIGPVRVLYDTGTPELGDYYGPKNGQWTLSEGYPGDFCVLGDYDYEDDPNVGLFSFKPCVNLQGKCAATLPAGSGATPGSGTMTIWFFDSGTATASGLTVTVLNYGLAIPAGQLIQARLVEGEWLAMPPAMAGIPVYNASGETIPAWAIMKPSGMTADVVSVIKPDGDFVPDYLVNGPNAISAAGFGTALSFGDVNIGSLGASADSGWGPSPGAWGWTQYAPQLMVAFADDGVWCRGVIAPILKILVKLYGPLNPGGNAQANIWAGVAAGEADTGFNQLTVYDKTLPTGTTLPAGTFLWAEFVDGQWYVASAAAGQASIIRIEGGGLAGQAVTADGYCLWRGTHLVVDDTMSLCVDHYIAKESVWVMAIDNPGGSDDGTAQNLIQGDRYLGILVGSYTEGSGDTADSRPLYAIRRAQSRARLYTGTLATTLSSGDATTTFVSDLVPMDLDAVPGTLPDLIDNDYGLAGATSSPCVVVQDFCDSSWVILQVKHIAQDYVTQVYLDGDDNIVDKDRVAVIMASTDEAGPNTIIESTDCSGD